MSKLIEVSLVAGMLACLGCSDSDDAAPADAAAGGLDASGADAMNGGGAGYVTASGTLNGTALSVSCDAAWYTQPFFGSLLQCQAGGLHLIQCRHDDSDTHGVMGQPMVAIGLIADGDTAVNQDDSFTTIKLGGTLDSQLTKDAANNTAHSITIDSFQRGTSVKGSFSATWSNPNDGGDYGEISGTFDYPCE